MTFCEFTASENDNDRRLDRILRRFIQEQNLSSIYSAIRKGLIRVNEKKAIPQTHIMQGDKIKIADFLLSQNTEGHAVNTSQSDFSKKFEIVFQNQHILVVNKPCGISVHGNANSLDKQVQAFYKETEKDNSLSFSPGPLHRIDKNTTGLIVFSWSIQGARWFSENIATGKISKTYLGIASGILKNEENWKDYISKNEKSNGFYTVNASTKQNEISEKIAITTATPLAYGNYQKKDITLVQYKIKTGRTHQIRSQSALHNHPLLGDTVYGAEQISLAHTPFFLHAQKLEIPENPIELPKILTAKLPENFRKFLKMSNILDY